MAIEKRKLSKLNQRKTAGEQPSASTEGAPSPMEQDFRVVGIGASAGGLEAIEQFFSHMPPDSGMAFIIVQHLDPVRHSSMPEIMSRLTKMPVYMVSDGMKVAPDSIYLIPPDRNMGIQNGALYLHEVPQPRGLRLPVDFFLRSLAKERGANAIGIILSGTGTDGTLGLRAIKAELGAVCVQDPESARYDGMPRSAIDTGLADFVLPPQEMPRQIMEFVKHVAVSGAWISAADGESTEPLQQVFTILRTRTGHDFSRYKQTTFRRRLERRMSVNGTDDVAEYARFLKENEPETKALLKDILISVTSFFRDTEAFNVLKENLKELVKTRAQGIDLRVWVAGCATGEEAYAIAIVISECLDELKKRFQVKIYATDIDSDALNIARAGIYPANIAADVTPARLKRFFLKQESSYQIKKDLREMVVFAPQNFIKDPPFSKTDLICCRNLLIYLESNVQKRMMPLLHYALRPGGILFLGPSETVGDATDLFSTLDKKLKIFRRKEVIISPERLRFPPVFAPFLREPTTGPITDQTKRLPALTEKIFLDNYAPTFAVIDEKYRLVYVRGRTGKYLEIASGQPSLSIMEMAREGLRNELASLIYEATAQKKMVAREGVLVKYNGGFQAVNLTVAPLTEYGIIQGLLMVVFQESGLTTVEGKTKPASGRRRHVALVEEELSLTKENLQKTVEEMEAVNEELKSANEELQSNNEELQSTNEELDTSREELQSLNEEMVTVNSELTSNNELLTSANDDLRNYLNRTGIAIVFLDNELNIRRFSPETAEVFNIRDIDIGRSLDDITSRLAYASVVDNAREVLRTLQSREIEVQRKDGRWYNMRILPYLTFQNVLGGLVMIFLDIDQQKQAAAGLRLLAAIVKDSNDAITTQDMEGQILTWNRAAERMYGYSEAEALRMNSVQLVPEEERAQHLQFFEDIKRGKEIKSLDVRRKTKDGRIIYVWTNFTKLIDDQGHPVGITTIDRDITGRKLAEEKIRASLREKEVLLQEIHHRVKNNLQIVSSLLDIQVRTTKNKNASEILSASRNRINTMALIHTQLYENTNLSEINMKEFVDGLIGQLFQSYPVQDVKITPVVHVADYPLPISMAVPVGLILNELLTNAFKYAFAERKKGEIKVSLDVSEKGDISLTVSDDGVGLAPGFDIDKSKTLGLQLVKTLIEDQLHGKIRIISKEGTTVTIEFKKENGQAVGS